jgi:peptide/nickel transport system substrate-binding protein
MPTGRIWATTRREMLIGGAALAGAATLPNWVAAQSTGVLRIGMTAADIPQMTGAPDNGFEGYRFCGYTLYDALCNWDLSSATKTSDVVPGLAESWQVDEADKTKWIFKLRQGVKFHDGSPFNADAVVWNYDKLLNKSAPQFDARQVGLIGFRIPSVKTVKKVDDYTIEITTPAPDAFIPYQVVYIPIASPAQWEKLGKDWAKVNEQPSGTGPFKVDKYVQRQRVEFVANKEYWDKNRVPKTERVVLLPLPEANSRTSALLSGQVDWIEQPSPDAVPQLKSAGMNLVSNGYPHIWPYHPSVLENSPFHDIRVRKAINLAIDRNGIANLMGGLALPAKGHVLPDSPWFGKPSFELKYDPDQAKKLLADAGYGPGKPLTIKFAISASGSGQMLPLPMNEYVQQNLADIGVKLEFDVTEWQALVDRWRAGAKADVNKGIHAVNVSYATQDPFTAFNRLMRSDLHAPAGVNWGFYSDPEMDKLLLAAQTAFTKADRDAALASVHEKMVNDALFIWVVHDVGPRAMSPQVKGFVQAKNWFQDLTPVSTG